MTKKPRWWKRMGIFLRERARRARNQRSLQFTLSVTFTLAAVVSMLFLTFSLSRRYNALARRTVYQDNQRLVSQINYSLDARLRDAMRISDSLYYGVIKKYDLDSKALKQNMALIYESNANSISDLALFEYDGVLLTAEPYGQLNRPVTLAGEPWFRSALKTIENIHFSTPYVQRLFGEGQDSFRWVISISRAVELTRGGNVYTGVLLVDLNYSEIRQIFKSIDMGEESYVYLIDERGEILYHPRQQLINSGLAMENNRQAATYGDGTHEEKFGDHERAVTIKTVGYTGWKIVSVTDMSMPNTAAASIRVYTIFFVLIAMALIVLADLSLSQKLGRPLRLLEEEVRKIERGESREISIQTKGSQEVLHLNKAIFSLMRQQDELRRDIVAQQESKRRSELDALQSQIHPHFLYNTLDSIVWMIESGRYEGATQMVTALARFFRLSLSGGQTIITVREEMEQVHNYLLIQQVRFKNVFTYRFEVTPDAEACLSVKLIVQPLVENAIYHGMVPLGEGGEILIRAWTEGDDLYIEVNDNGPGMTPEQIDALRCGRARGALRSSSGSGIGVANVRERIQLYFGASYGLEISSEADVGTSVRLHLPRRKEGDSQ